MKSRYKLGNSTRRHDEPPPLTFAIGGKPTIFQISPNSVATVQKNDFALLGGRGERCPIFSKGKNELMAHALAAQSFWDSLP